MAILLFKDILLFIYFWLQRVLVMACWILPCGEGLLSSCGMGSRAHRLSSYSMWAWLSCGMWNHARPAIEPVFSTLECGLLTTGSPQKSHTSLNLLYWNQCFNYLTMGLNKDILTALIFICIYIYIKALN